MQELVDEAVKAITASVLNMVESAIFGKDKPGVFPDWVYKARLAVRTQSESLTALLKEALEWENDASLHECLNAVRRLVAESKPSENKDINYHMNKWMQYEREFILPCFDLADNVDIDLRKLVREHAGKNCVVTLVEELISRLKQQSADPQI